MDDYWIVSGSPFDRIDCGDGRVGEGISSEAVDRLGWKPDHTARFKDIDGTTDSLCKQGRGVSSKNLSRHRLE